MRGMLIGAGVGFLAVIVVWAVLAVTGVWTAIGVVPSMLGGFILGSVLTNLGIWIGGLLDDSY